MTNNHRSLIKAKNEGIEKVVASLFSTKTPKEFIKSRPGPGGTSLTYVEVGYVVSTLNNAFGPFWEWKITDKSIGNKQVWVEGQLTVKNQNDGFEITKTGFGGSLIKISKATNEPVNIANDLKAASSDALKKAASLFGIASDIFYKEMDVLEEVSDIVEIDEEEQLNRYLHDQLVKKYFATSKQKGFSPEEAKLKIKEVFKVEHMADLSNNQLESAIKAIELKYMDVTGEEKPQVVKATVASQATEVNQIESVQTELNASYNIDDEEMKKREAVFSRAAEDCGNPECKKGVNGTRGLANTDPVSGYRLFCSPECKSEYWNDK